MENDAEVVFINQIEVSGFVNGVVNMAFSTMQFVPQVDPEGKPFVSSAPKITANLRFDLLCAQEIVERLQTIIEQHTKPKVSN